MFIVLDENKNFVHNAITGEAIFDKSTLPWALTGPTTAKITVYELVQAKVTVVVSARVIDIWNAE